MYNKNLEFIVGGFVLLGFMAFLFLAVQVSGMTSYFPGKTFTLKANFDNIGDLKPRAAVTIAGVKIGQVTKVDLDTETYRATVTLSIDNKNQRLPVSTSASVFTEGLLGSNYISLTPGFAEDEKEFLKEGDTIETTYSAIILEDLIGKFMFQVNGKGQQQS